MQYAKKKSQLSICRNIFQTCIYYYYWFYIFKILSGFRIHWKISLYLQNSTDIRVLHNNRNFGSLFSTGKVWEVLLYNTNLYFPVSVFEHPMHVKKQQNWSSHVKILSGILLVPPRISVKMCYLVTLHSCYF